MSFLLDTCTLLWYFEGSAKIPETLRDALTDPVNEVLASDVRVLEIVLQYSLGKLAFPRPPSVFLPVLIERHLIEHLPLSRDAIFRLESLPGHHRDPFDRLLIAQALVPGTRICELGLFSQIGNAEVREANRATIRRIRSGQSAGGHLPGPRRTR